VKIQILRDKYIGSGNCVLEAEHLFTQSEEDGKVLLNDGDETDDPKAVQAAILCPVGAITIDGKLP
jgi:ferredoxin